MSEASQDKLLALPGGRTLAYQDYGNSGSSTVLMFLHGACSVGDAREPCRTIRERDIHFITPTLPGWGRSSPVPAPQGKNYATYLTSAISTLLEHLHPNSANMKLFIGGGSFGSVPAQILYGAPYSAFPYGRNIAAVGLMAPFSYIRYHVGYQKHLPWQSYISVGPPARHVPFNLVPRLICAAMRRYLANPQKAEAFLRKMLFSNMGPAELAEFARWREENDKAEGALERQMGEGAARSVANGWDGFLGMAQVLHADWGFDPHTLSEDHRRPLFVVTGSTDAEVPEAMADWIMETYGNGTKRVLNGGHISAMFQFNTLIAEFLDIGRDP